MVFSYRFEPFIFLLYIFDMRNATHSLLMLVLYLLVALNEINTPFSKLLVVLRKFQGSVNFFTCGRVGALDRPLQTSIKEASVYWV